MRAFVTGGTGFIGSRLVSKLRSLGWEVVCLVRRPVQSDDKGISCVEGDLLNVKSLHAVLSQVCKFDVVFHLAAMLPQHCKLDEEWKYFIVNCVSTYQLLRLSNKLRVGSFVYISSLPVIGKPELLPINEDHPVAPSHPYLLSKLNGELACELVRRTSEMQVTSLRITSPYGPGMVTDTVIPRFVSSALVSEEIYLYGSGQRSQNFVHVDDIVDACLLAANTANSGIFNIGGSESYSMQDLANTIVRHTPESRSLISFSGEVDLQEDYRWEISLLRSKNELNFSPRVSFSSGLAGYIEYRKARFPLQHWWNPS